MHNKIDLPYLDDEYNRHILHHKNVNSNTDFSLKDNKLNGLCFGINISIILFIIIVIICYVLFNRLVSLNVILITCIVYIIYNKIMWNSIYSYVHNIDVYKICDNSVLNISKPYVNENNIYINWIIKNHQAHHYYKDKEKGNYNILFPGADYILGTYKTMPE